MEAQSLVAITAVVVTGFVSVLNGFVPFLIDWRKAKRDEARVDREQLAAEIAKIDQTTLELLGHLSHFRHWTIDDIETSYHGSAQRAYSELRAKHYAWEVAVWARLEEKERRQVRELRTKFENVHTPNAVAPEVSDLSEQVLSVTKTATRRQWRHRAR